MKKKLTLIEVLAVVLTIFLVITILLFPEKEYSRDQVVIAFGDSLTVGYGTPPGKNYVVYLSEYTNIPIVNAGLSGDTTSEALIRLRGDILDKNPSIVIIMLGGNDFFDGYNEEVVRINLKTIIRKIKSSGAKVILIGISKQFIPSLEKVFAKLAWEEGVDGYVPNILRGILLRKDLMYDDIHPNTRGHKIVADRILPVLEKILREP